MLCVHTAVKLIYDVCMQVTELKPEWLVEIAPHFYQMKDVEDGMISRLFCDDFLVVHPSNLCI